MTSECEGKSAHDDVTREDQERFMKEALLMVIIFCILWSFFPSADTFKRRERGLWQLVKLQ